MSYKYDPLVGSAAVSSAAAEGAAPFMGPVDITETPESFVFVTDCPGLSSKDVHVRVTHNLLQLSGERDSTKETDDSHVHRLERTSGKFCRTFRLPSGCDIHNVKAMCEHGVLTVTVAKDDETRKAALLKNDMLSLSEGDGSLNAEFKKVPMSVFPTPKLGKIVTLRSDDSILQAVRTLSEHHILSAPVVDVNAPADAGWTEKYIGMVDMVGIVFHMLEKLDTAAPEDFAAEIEKVDAFRKTTVAEAVSFAGFGPFVPVDVDYGTLLDCMLLCGAHAFRRLPVVKTPAGDIVNIITQSALVQTLEANLERFKSVGSKTLSELDLGRKGGVLLVKESQPLKDAFKLIHDNDISAVPVVNDKGAIVGNVSARDARLIVSSKKIYKLLNMPVSTYLSVVTDGAENSAITCKPSDTLESVIRTLVASRIHRVYVVDDENKPLRVVSLRNVLTKFVKEEPGYFGHFFN